MSASPPPRTVNNFFCRNVENATSRMEDPLQHDSWTQHDMAKIMAAALNTLHRVARGFLVRKRLLSICEERVFVVDDADAAAFVMSGHSKEITC